MKPSTLILFSFMCIAQWYIPGAMIAGQENILAGGKPFRFKTSPIDPSDPFRGKYITLNFEASTFQHPGCQWERGKKVWVVLKEDHNGFAAIADITETLADSAKGDYLEAVVSFCDEEAVRVSYPFERFYLEESKASDAELVYWDETHNDSTQTAYALVWIKNGKAALADVKINERSIVDVVRELNAGKP